MGQPSNEGVVEMRARFDDAVKAIRCSRSVKKQKKQRTRQAKSSARPALKSESQKPHASTMVTATDMDAVAGQSYRTRRQGAAAAGGTAATAPTSLANVRTHVNPGPYGTKSPPPLPQKWHGNGAGTAIPPR